ncbi:MAG: chemotaxis protein CheX [Rubinisphaera brasiliensis]|uniref:CheC domain protein n=1 Tax=Rubinisphaera brasiliensis (strain ATCC 49424 / DSM 5305 / JCM 21570 / IAM 15109 / NBRC 103401 / IFAM 1448) TaxID=756272 RepID=F0SM46_RUBBR|nr:MULTISPECIES: chemotaxis protein CheX [Rubinisphaera]ADY61001.1 CheC domain protein [Rubinisphaera brasiliensis DSM 5305]MBR9802257.1 chemotaxis protein CheX [bacterium]
MSNTQQMTAATTTALVNPIISSVIRTFESMLSATPKRTGLELRNGNTTSFPLSAIVALTGEINGTIVFSVSEEVALEIVRRLVFEDYSEINAEVCDAVGEIANMIAGSAKADLAHLELSLGIPNMVHGDNHEVHYPPEVKHPMCILFDSELGQFSIEFGFRC